MTTATGTTWGVRLGAALELALSVASLGAVLTSLCCDDLKPRAVTDYVDNEDPATVGMR